MTDENQSGAMTEYRGALIEYRSGIELETDELTGHAPQGWQSPNKSILISLGFHAAIILLLVFGLHFLHRSPLGFDVPRPIAVTLLSSPDSSNNEMPVDASSEASIQAVQASSQTSPASQPAQPATAALQAPAPAPSQAVATQPAASDSDPVVSDALPYDPSFNPFGPAAPQTEEKQAADATPSPPTDPGPTAQPSAPAPSELTIDNMAIGPNRVQANPGSLGNGLSGTGAPGQAQAGGNPLGRLGNGTDPTLHPQYLEVKLNGFINASSAPQLQRFLVRLIACGVHPIQVKNPDMTVEADVTFAPNGMMQSARLTNPTAFPGDRTYDVAAGRLMTALSNPACTYIQLPPFQYQNWRAVHVSFFQRQ